MFILCLVMVVLILEMRVLEDWIEWLAWSTAFVALLGAMLVCDRGWP